jgi:hypothetical protein
MANVTVFDISGGVVTVKTTSSIAAAATTQTVPVGKDNRLALRVANGNATAVTVRLKSGDGPRAPLGDNDVVVAANSTAYIALYDTARYKSGGVVTVALMQGTGDTATALGETERGEVQIEAAQL